MQYSPELLWVERLEQEPAWVAEIEGRVIAAACWTKSFGQAVEIGRGGHPILLSVRRRLGGHPGGHRGGAGAGAADGAPRDPERAALDHPLGFQLGRARAGLLPDSLSAGRL